MKSLKTCLGLMIALVIVSACMAPVVAPGGTPVAPEATASPAESTPVIECSGAPTIAQTEGPMYVADPPQRTDLRTDPRNAGGQPLILTATVVDRQCRPIAGAVVDIWHTDAQGAYDLSESYASRGYALTDAAGKVRFETIFPFIYMGRTAHIHVKITPPGGKTLTTQLYFPNEATNSGDAIFEPSLLVTLADTSDGQEASYTFVLE